VVFSSSDLYESRRLSRGAGEVVSLVRAVALATLLAGALGVLLDVPALALRPIVQAWLLFSAIAASERLVLRGLLNLVRRSGRNLRHVLIVGSDPDAERVVQELLSEPHLGYRILGYLDEREGGAPILDGAAYLGDLKQIDQVLAESVIDEVIVALPARTLHAGGALVIESCERQGIAVTVPLHPLDTALGSVRVDILDHTPLLRYTFHRVTGWPALAKRAFDVVAAAALLVLLAPLFPLVAVLIKRDSRGPVFFVQDRVGLHKRVFRLIKFRTMVDGAEARLEQVLHLNEVEGPVFKVRDDPRVTRLGRRLRRGSVDELPQLLNVLRGDMSLVGPRPLPLRDVRGFSEDWLRRRFSVKPGITCFWQVSGRSALGFHQWMELDLRYIENWSLGLDLKILLQTLPAVLRGTGAH
jgi:exopolysaccharide biosynthesis polyprenyl glycosylphosphotransferase